MELQGEIIEGGGRKTLRRTGEIQRLTKERVIKMKRTITVFLLVKHELLCSLLGQNMKKTLLKTH